jgi:TPR repeat protein
MKDDSPVIAYDKACKLYLEIHAIKDPAEYTKRTRELNALFKVYFQKLWEGANAQDPDVWCALGSAFDLGRGVKRNIEEAIRWYQRAAEAGHTKAMVNLGLCLQRPEASSSDVSAAVRWFREAAARGDHRGMIWLGFSYRDGKGIPCDLAAAVQWFIKAVEAGDAHSMIHVGRMYAQYLSSPAEALPWFLRAAKAGLSEGPLCLAFLYNDRRSDMYDPVEAIKWYSVVAAGSGRSAALAMLVLARKYRDGVGTSRDPEMVKQWLHRFLQVMPEDCPERKQAIKMLQKIQEKLP